MRTLAFLLCSAAFAQLPGQYPPGQGPGQYPPGQGPNGPNGRGRYPGQTPYPQPGQTGPNGRGRGPEPQPGSRTSRTRSAATITTTTAGILRRATTNQLVIEADDHRIIWYR